MNAFSHKSGDPEPLILPFTALNHTMLALAGGKGANLGELVGANLPVPDGFCVTTVAYAHTAEQADLDALLATLTSESTSPAFFEKAVRERLRSTAMPSEIATAITEAYDKLGEGKAIPVAVRSSATAEDLPGASFAGQQETYLNIVGAEAVLDAVQRCWASLWTERAISYREHFGIDHRTTRLAVVMQSMVDASVAGVLFTANPLTGKRRQAVIDANPGLGEAVVSGATNPDHLVVNTPTGEIVERAPGNKRVVIRAIAGGGTERIEREDNQDLCLSDAQIRDLVQLGSQVEAHYKAPQDIEWALDAAGRFWLTQARPITTLFPLPAKAPLSDEILRVYFSVSVLQGVYRPLTPMGISAFRFLGSAIATLAGLPPGDPRQGPTAFTIAASRLFLDVTPALRHSIGRSFMINALGRFVEARSADLFKQIITDPHLSITSESRGPVIRLAFSLLVKNRLLFYLMPVLLRPSTAQARIAKLETTFRSLGTVPANASAAEHLAVYEQMMLHDAVPLISRVMSFLICGVASFALASVLLKDLASAEDLQKMLRGLPSNPTIEMDLSLWALAQHVRTDEIAAHYVTETAPEQMARDYHAEKLPPTLQKGLTEFLSVYGHRGVAEIDLGLPHWSEDPTHLLGMLTNYLQLTDPTLAPDKQFQRSRQEAEAMVTELVRRATRKSWWRGAVVKFCLKRVRALAGLRERPKYYVVLLLARARNLLRSVGETLVQSGQIATVEDIFFLTAEEAAAALAGTDMHATVRERRADYEREMQRRHIPRVLLSDGREPVLETPPSEDGREVLKGSSASPGTITAQARVILDPTGARLFPGEILVAPSTDPGWTPLFLTASGLVMEMGGAMSHGAVVAREYGIPAVVGVPGATERITNGQCITVDGSKGIVTL
ncbi:MAG TPA: PEP/pyruvate-binding domain-containing protein [Ktedonobacteraceae bacterium]|nr:PEP/pyruvate-binding domain-containing protein [Ktedonobacteraceae bacterium]